MKILIDP